MRHSRLWSMCRQLHILLLLAFYMHVSLTTVAASSLFVSSDSGSLSLYSSLSVSSLSIAGADVSDTLLQMQLWMEEMSAQLNAQQVELTNLKTNGTQTGGDGAETALLSVRVAALESALVSERTGAADLQARLTAAESTVATQAATLTDQAAALAALSGLTGSSTLVSTLVGLRDLSLSSSSLVSSVNSQITSLADVEARLGAMESLSGSSIAVSTVIALTDGTGSSPLVTRLAAVEDATSTQS
jgi:uncharacterized coiled-coil protein SlyX